MIVREATPDDAAGIAFVHVRTWQQAYRGQVPDAFLDALSVPDREEAWRKGMLADPERPVWVAEHSGRIVGFVDAGPAGEGDDVGEVYAIYVLAEHWDTGAGRELMTRALAWLRERYDHATLWVLDTNDRARLFYERGGWEPDGTMKDDDSRGFMLREMRYRIELRLR